MILVENGIAEKNGITYETNVDLLGDKSDGDVYGCLYDLECISFTELKPLSDLEKHLKLFSIVK